MGVIYSSLHAVVHLILVAHCSILSQLLLQAVSTAKGQALADEYGIQFFETVSYCAEGLILSLINFLQFHCVSCISQSAKTNLNVEQVFFSIARDIKQRLAETDSKPEV
jgi:Ras-related protein Rab-8A